MKETDQEDVEGWDKSSYLGAEALRQAQSLPGSPSHLGKLLKFPCIHEMVWTGSVSSPAREKPAEKLSKVTALVGVDEQPRTRDHTNLTLHHSHPKAGTTKLPES